MQLGRTLEMTFFTQQYSSYIGYKLWLSIIAQAGAMQHSALPQDVWFLTLILTGLCSIFTATDSDV